MVRLDFSASPYTKQSFILITHTAVFFTGFLRLYLNIEFFVVLAISFFLKPIQQFDYCV